MTREEWNSAFAPKGVFRWEYLLFDEIRRFKHAIDFAYLLEAFDAGVYWKDVVLFSRFHKQRTWSNQTGDVVHLGPVENPGNVVVHAMREAAHAVAERVEVTADHRDSNPRLKGRGEKSRGAAAGNAHAADAAGIQFQASPNVVQCPHDVPSAPRDQRLTKHQRAAC